MGLVKARRLAAMQKQQRAKAGMKPPKAGGTRKGTGFPSPLLARPYGERRVRGACPTATGGTPVAPVSRQDGGSPYGGMVVPRRNRTAGFLVGGSPCFGEYAILLP